MIDVELSLMSYAPELQLGTKKVTKRIIRVMQFMIVGYTKIIYYSQ
jgi:hypothetical protein